jgi:hypothetical protein
MRKTVKVIGVALAVTSLGGCASLQANQTACRAVAFGTGGAIGAVAAGVPVSQTDGVSSGEVGGAVAGGFIAGALIGTLISLWACPDPPPPPPPPPAVTEPEPPPPPPPTERRGG